MLWLLLLCSILLFSCQSKEPSAPDSPDFETTDTESEGQAAELLLDLSQYQIIRPNSSDFTALASRLENHFADIGLALSVAKDSDVSVNSQAHEILLGGTNRPESAELLATLPKDRGYIIAFTDTKIVIAARNTEFLSEAVQDFADNYLTQLRETRLTVSRNESKTGAPCTAYTLVENGEARARVVCALNAKEDVKQAAGSIVNRIQGLTSVSLPIIDEYEQEKNGTDITVGQISTVPEATEVLRGWKVNEYGVTAFPDQIVVVGHTDSTTASAASVFIKYLQSAECVKTSETADTYSLTVYLPAELKDSEQAWLADYPHYDGGSYDAAYLCGNDTVQMRYTEVDPSTLDGYLAKLEAAGYARKQDNDNNGETGNRFVTLLGEKGSLHLSYFAFNQTLTVLSDPMTKTFYYEQGEELPSVEEQSTLAVMTLDYSQHPPVNGCDPRLNDGGLSYIITLRDGRFIVIDGGWKDSDGTHDCDILYEFMYDHTKLTDESGNNRIVIAAWIFTHDSPDHHEAFLSFVPKYCGENSIVSVEYTIYNMGVEAQYSKGYRTGLVTQEPVLRAKYLPGCQMIQPHTGQKLRFADVEFEFLYTLEALAPKLGTDANDASMLFRMTVDGMTTLFTGDAVTQPCDMTERLYGSYAQSDVMQINHHGTTGLTVGLYNCVDPLYALWPTSETSFAARTSGKAYPVGCPSETTVKLNVRIIEELNQKHNTTDVSVHSWYADGPIEILSFSPDKVLTVTDIYTVNPELLPERPPFTEA